MIETILMILLITVPYLFDDWYARIVFVWIGYPRKYGHGKSAKRATKHYRSTWSFCQRILWIPVFKEPYEVKYRRMVYFSYIHFLLTITTLVCFLIGQMDFWFYLFIADSALFILRFLHDHHIATTKYQKHPRYKYK